MSQISAARYALPAAPVAGFTLVELLITIGIVGVLSSVAVVNYASYVEKARVARAVSEIASISRAIDARMAFGDEGYPDSLTDVDSDHMVDPWGNPYVYLKLFGALGPGFTQQPGALPPVASAPGPSALAQARKDKFLVPINSDYDLYSRGADGLSNRQLDSQVSLDDVVRARDGAYVGLAEFF